MLYNILYIYIYILYIYIYIYHSTPHPTPPLTTSHYHPLPPPPPPTTHTSPHPTLPHLTPSPPSPHQPHSLHPLPPPSPLPQPFTPPSHHPQPPHPPTTLPPPTAGQTNFRFCCLAREVRFCHPPPDEFSSCEDLMTNIMLRVCVWVLGTVAFTGNLLVIVWRFIYHHDNKVHSFLITNLALGDLCMGIYLLIIAAVDVNYRGVYFIYDALWRTSSLCQLAGFLSTFSSELSVFTLTVITLERFVVIIFPFRVSRLNMNWTRIIMGVVWASVGVLAALPLSNIHYFRLEKSLLFASVFYRCFVELLREVGCLPRPSHHTREAEWWQYSVFVFLALNLISFSVIAASYWGMYRAARTTSAAVIRSDQQRRDSNMAKKMTLIVVTDAACWLPIILLGFVSLAGGRIPPQVFAWVAVFVLPLNAAVNPLLYTLSTAPFLGKARERGVGRATLLQEVDHSAYPVTTTGYNNIHRQHSAMSTTNNQPTISTKQQQCLPPTLSTNNNFHNNSNVYHQHFSTNNNFHQQQQCLLLTTISILPPNTFTNNNSTNNSNSTNQHFLLTTISTQQRNVYHQHFLLTTISTNNSNVYHQHFLLTTISTNNSNVYHQHFLLTTISTNNSNATTNTFYYNFHQQHNNFSTNNSNGLPPTTTTNFTNNSNVYHQHLSTKQQFPPTTAMSTTNTFY
ncbi:G-protein coupled receptor [Penaeus vannamei]|uniref:G-protein coupled receptor n=1 Tax=Penaeus vannamei TaxID=6689 RepID=A0A423U6R0_PENVA|nr:G-protein coupled receptor [Penaeus vannamei]